MKDPKTVFVISSDFCHWGPNFDFQYYDKSKGAIWQSIEALDKEGVQFIESQDANVHLWEGYECRDLLPIWIERKLQFVVITALRFT